MEYYLRAGDGEEPDLEALCGHDDALIARVRELLSGVPEAFQPRPFTDTADDPRIGTTVDGFTILQRLGRGGMGSVYLASQERPRRRVALKLLDRADLGDERARRRFQREADLVAALDHPSIVPIHASGEHDGLAYLAMKRLEGPSLDEMTKPLTTALVAQIGFAIASALDESHRFGIVHRDIKPSNILMDNGTPVLVDFGLARSVTDATLTRDGHVAGTLPYLAPECLAGAGPALDPRVDVYGLGATLYELLAGHPPFDAESTEVLLSRIAWDDHAPLDLARADRDLATIIDKALEKNPQHRIASMTQFADELTRFLEGRPLTLRPVGRLERSVRWVRRHPRLAATALAAVVVFGTLVTITSLSRADERRTRAGAIALARVEMDAERYGRAAEILAQIRAPQPTEQALAAEARARDALEQLLDDVIDFTSSISERQFRSRVATVIDSNASTYEPELAALALAIAHWHLGEGDAAHAALEASAADAPWVRARSAVRGLLDNDWTLAAATTDVADEHVVTAIVMRLVGSTPDEIDAELQSALVHDPQHHRGRVQKALFDLDTGRAAEALVRLQGLTRERPESRTLRRHLARAQHRTGDVESARRSLELIDRAAWTPAEAVLDLDLLSVEAGVETALETARAHLAHFTAQDEPAWDVVIAEASQLSVAPTRTADAVARLERVERDASLSLHRDKAAANRYRMLVDEATHAQDRARVYGELAEEGRRLLGIVRFPPARAVLQWKYAKTLARMGYFADFVRIMENAVPQLDHMPWARHEFAVDLLGYSDHQRRFGSTPSDQAIVRHFERAAWEHARAALELSSESDPTSQRLQMLASAIESARRVGDWAAIAAMLRLPVAAHLPADEREQLSEAIDDFDDKLHAAFSR